MKRYEFYQGEYGYEPPSLVPADDGEYVRYDDAQAAIAAAVKEERETFARLSATFRVNMLRYCPAASHAEIDALVERARGAA
jgi:hypothetical protein